MKAKKILCLLLSIIMIIGMVPIAHANEETIVEDKSVYDIISSGIGSAEAYINQQLDKMHADGGVLYGFEWYITSMLRAGKDVSSEILDEYYASVCDTAKDWDEDVKPTDAEKVAIVLSAMDKDVTDIQGVDLINLIFNSKRLDEGANELAYALIALYASGEEIPDTAKWDENSVIEKLLEFQTTDGGFVLNSNAVSEIDITAICVQALAPHKSVDAVNAALDKAIDYLTYNISQDWDYLNNPNSTAQVLAALAALKIDVTDPANGFGNDMQENIVSALEKYRNEDGNGYVYGTSVNSMATVQVMQAYDAYRKAHKENISYWDFGTVGQIYEDSTENEEEKPEENQASPADIYVTISNDGKIVADKDGGYVAQAKVTVVDINKDGMLTVDEALYATHEKYYDGGAQAGYATFAGSLSVLWGKGTPGSFAAASYYLNNVSCWSLDDTIKEGDFLTAFNYFDTIFWSDAYSYFDKNNIESQKGNTVTLTLNYVSGYDAVTYAPIISACSDAKVALFDRENNQQDVFTTDENGKVNITFGENPGVGDYYAVAYKDDNSLVPAVCSISVFAESGGGSGGSVSKNISVYISVADPKGTTYLEKTAYSVKKATTAYELLKKTGLNVQATESINGIYIKAIEGLGELDEGTGSGWMYCVNGKYPEYSSSSYTLSDGDYVEWVYTREFGDDISSGKGSYGSISASTNKDKTNPEEEIVKTAFSDVSADAYYADAVEYVVNKNLFGGISENEFAPDMTMTREMLVTVLWRLNNSPIVNHDMSFEDVKEDAWYTEAVRWAASEKIVLGISEKAFGINTAVTREQIAAILKRYSATETYKDVEIENFDDAEDISAYALDAMKWVVSEGIMNGSGNKLLPSAYATRAQVATMIARFCEAFEK